MSARALPDRTVPAGDCCGPVTVHVRTGGGLGGDPAYAGGWIEGFTGHKYSMMPAAQMRALARALILAAEAIETSGLPSLEQVRSAR